MQNQTLVFPKKKRTIYFLRNPLRIRAQKILHRDKLSFSLFLSLSLSLKKNLAKFEERDRTLLSPSR